MCSLSLRSVSSVGHFGVALFLMAMIAGCDANSADESVSVSNDAEPSLNETSQADPVPDVEEESEVVKSETVKSEEPQESVATLAGGCFWCTEAVFERMRGVNDVVSGYIGGHVVNPTYEQVCAKESGHAEAVEIYYDPSVTTYEELLEVFFKTHDPTTLNRQGADAGPQYRSSVFYHDDAQKAAAEKYIQKLNDAGEGPIVTLLEEATKFYPAEEYHQDYFRLNPNQGYCQAIVRSKVEKFNTEFGDKLKKEEVEKEEVKKLDEKE